jgi:hypothetical protein
MVSDEKRSELLNELNEAKNNGVTGVCNWCGEDGNQLNKTGTAMISDIKHVLYECDSCGEITAVYNWNGQTWRAAIQDTTVTPTYTLVRGSK